MEDPSPLNSILEFDNYIFKFKIYLKCRMFSYKCANRNIFSCPFLLSNSISNYDPITWECKSTHGAFQASRAGHSELCIKDRDNKIAEEIRLKQMSELALSKNNEKMINFCEWGSDLSVLKAYIKMNLTQGPTTIRTNLRKFKQNYTLRLVKDTKKEILNEIFPKDKNIAFHPSNCLVKEYEDIREDNLFKLYSQIPLQNPSYAKEISGSFQEFYIFSSNLMLYQLEQAKQWFIDGTFSVAPVGFQQLLTIIVYLPLHNVFYSAAYILLTNKSGMIYNYAFKAL